MAVTQGDMVKTGVRECIKKWNEILARKTNNFELLAGSKDFFAEVMGGLLEVLSTLPG